MIDLARLRTVLDLHEKSFALLKWVGRQMRAGSLDVSGVHVNLSVADAAESWIRRNAGSLPADIRPGDDELTPFARLFASYLRTSFEIGRGGSPAALSGCLCEFCAYLRAGACLKPRSLSRRARETAVELKRLCLAEIARDSEAAADAAALQKLADAEPPLGRDVAIAAYAKELIRRTEYVSQGEGVYALWREFAWVDGHPDPRFRLAPELVERAIGNIVDAVKGCEARGR